MAGMYPDNKEITVFGKTVKFPGVNAEGKFTNGDFSNPDVPPSFLDANTVNLIIDNLNALIAHLGGNANNTDADQLKKLFSITAEANKAIKRDAAGRAKVAAPVEADDIARKAEVDAETQARTQGDSAISGQLSSHTGNRSNPHGVTASQIGLGNVDNTQDSQKSVKYAAKAGNADSVCGFSAGTDAGMLVPVVASDFGKNSGYIKLGNGLIVQWGCSGHDVPEAIFPIPFSNANYNIAIRVVWRSNISAAEGHFFVDKLPDRIIRNGRAGFPIEYIAIGN